MQKNWTENYLKYKIIDLFIKLMQGKIISDVPPVNYCYNNNSNF